MRNLPLCPCTSAQLYLEISYLPYLLSCTCPLCLISPPNLFETHALGLIQPGLRQSWPVHGSAADGISARNLACSNAGNSSCRGSSWGAMLSSGVGCHFLERSQAAWSGMHSISTVPSRLQIGLWLCVCRGLAEDSRDAGGVPTAPVLGSFFLTGVEVPCSCSWRNLLWCMQMLSAKPVILKH